MDIKAVQLLWSKIRHEMHPALDSQRLRELLEACSVLALTTTTFLSLRTSNSL